MEGEEQRREKNKKKDEMKKVGSRTIAYKSGWLISKSKGLGFPGDAGFSGRYGGCAYGGWICTRSNLRFISSKRPPPSVRLISPFYRSE